jgi:hypothetical protein
MLGLLGGCPMISFHVPMPFAYGCEHPSTRYKSIAVVDLIVDSAIDDFSS